MGTDATAAAPAWDAGVVDAGLAAEADGAGDGLRVRLLGGFRVHAGARPVPAAAWRLRRAAGLVKLLALAPGHRLHRDQVLEALWPEGDPAATRRGLYQVVYVVRRLLEPDPTPGARSVYLRTRAETVVLADDGRLWVDVEAFEGAAAAARGTRDPRAYRAALLLYGGELLPDDPYEDWATARRERLRELRRLLLTELAEVEAARGRRAEAVAALRQAVAADPADEAARVALMRQLALAGERRQALRHYRGLEEALRREADAEPGAAARRLYQEIRLGGPLSRDPEREEGAGDGGQDVQPPVAREPRHSLPHAVDRFVGRRRERAALERVLAGARLVTLTGPGGVGKTRLALQAAGARLDDFPDGVSFVPLAPLGDAGRVAAAVARALGLGDEGGRPPEARLAAYLRDKRTLLVLDNFEHVLAAAPLVAELLAACAHLKVLVTSRAPLRLSGEHEFPVPPLALPPESRGAPGDGRGAAGGAPDAAAALGSDAVALFVERAVAVRPDFAPADAAAPVLAAICRRLDGLPLAIELAAAWVRLLPPPALLERLGRALPLLTGGPRDAPARQQALRATIDWSYGLLTEPERALFARLAVFAGGFALEAAEAVAGGGEGTAGQPRLTPDGVLAGLAGLAEKSLLRSEALPDGRPRFAMLETVREYAHERLEASGQAPAVRDRHVRFFLELAEQAEPAFRSPQQDACFLRLEQEHDNLRLALRCCLEGGEAERALRLAAALWWFWYAGGHYQEGREHLEAALAAAEQASPEPAPGARRASPGTTDDAARARTLLGVGAIAIRQGAHVAARAALERCVGLARRLGDTRTLAHGLAYLGLASIPLPDRTVAASLLEESVALFRRAGDRWGLALALGYLGQVRLFQGDDGEGARPPLDEAEALFRALGDRWGLSGVVSTQGMLRLWGGDLPGARPRFEESLALKREAGDPWRLALGLSVLGALLTALGEEAQAVPLLEEALVLHREQGSASPVAFGLLSLGYADLSRGDLDGAAARIAEGAAVFRRLRDTAGLAWSLGAAGALAGAAGQPERAAVLLGAAEATLRRLARGAEPHPPLPNKPMEAIDRRIFERQRAAVRARLDAPAFEAARARGAALSLDAAAALAGWDAE